MCVCVYVCECWNKGFGIRNLQELISHKTLSTNQSDTSYLFKIIRFTVIISAEW